MGKRQLGQGRTSAYKYPPAANTVIEGRKYIAAPQAGRIKSKWPEVNKQSV